MKTLYESILDNEDDVINNMGGMIIKNHIYNKILTHIKGTRLEEKISLINDKLSINTRLDTNTVTMIDIFENKYINDIEYIKELSLIDFKNKYIKGVKYIKVVDKLILDQPFIKNFKKFDKLLIGDIKTCLCSINSSADWTKAFIYWRPNKLRLTRSMRRGEAPVKNINGLTVGDLILDCDLFEDFNKTNNHKQFKMTTTNAKDLDEIFKNNHFNNLYIKDFNLMTTDLWLVEKSKITYDNAITAKDKLELLTGHGYKLTRIKYL